MEMKYVVMDNMGKFNNAESFLVFPEVENHKRVVEGLGGMDHVVSAGFVSFRQGEDGIEASCYGVSVSLGIGSRREEDSRLLTMQMREY